MQKVNIFLGAGWAGLAALLAVFLGALVSIPEAILIAGLLICVACCWVMLFTRNADEYTRGLWTSGASMAFATLLILFLGLPFAEGVYDGFQSTRAGTPGQNNERDIPAIASIALAIIAFYIGLFWKRMRGGI
ncbi:hypothetical protein [Erythrobacter crassostreae]|uniref:Uncharacterized protein n=1 Tax=Erythrobacter crassostreae TaxID=2828328 RepID=A0A9X1F4G8_9SPHN|nr:hypothetical protein [Erythrobacter crassostrea]MBV7259952.1 hypothetical protein [Erythrobacter crassostrea]